VYGKATAPGPLASYGVYGEASGAHCSGVQGVATSDADDYNYGGRFEAYGKEGYGVYGWSGGTDGIGVYAEAVGTSGRGVYGYAYAVNGTNYAVYGKTNSSDGYGGYFLGRGYFSGNVGIGTTSPGEELHIYGDNPRILIEATSINPEINFKNTGDISTEIWALYKHGGTDDLRFYQGGDKVTIKSSTGNVGIGTTSPGSYKLVVNGSAAKPYGGSWSTFSDVRLKDIGERYEHGLEEITKIHPIKYRYKEENALGLPSSEEYVGLIAQEVKEVIPEAVEQNEQGYLMLNGDPINYAMLNAIKELSAEVKRLKKRIEELEKR